MLKFRDITLLIVRMLPATAYTVVAKLSLSSPA